jgi:hypothetical protein
MSQRKPAEQQRAKSANTQSLDPFVRQPQFQRPAQTGALTSPSNLSNAAVQRTLANPRALSPSDILQLQHTVGNRAVQRMLKLDQNPNASPQPARQPNGLNAPGPLPGSASPRIQRRFGKKRLTSNAPSKTDNAPAALPNGDTKDTVDSTLALQSNTNSQSNTDNGALMSLDLHRNYLGDGGTTRWEYDVGISASGAISPITRSLKLYRYYKSKKLGNAEEQAELLGDLQQTVDRSSYQSGQDRSTKSFQRRKAAATLLRSELGRELRDNPIRLSRAVGSAEKIKEVVKVGYTKAFLRSMAETDFALLYEAHAALAHRRLDLAQASLDHLNPIERDDPGTIKYDQDHSHSIKRQSYGLFFAQQMLVAYHHANIGGKYGRVFQPEEMSSDKLQNVTKKYLHNKGFLGDSFAGRLKQLAEGGQDPSQAMPGNSALTRQEIDAIRVYSSGDYKYMNGALRDVRLTNPKEQQHVKGYNAISQLVASGLSKLPNYNGKVVYRGDTDFGGLLNTARVGTTIHTPVFLSTSKNQNIARNFTGNGRVGWKIKLASPSRGKDIDSISLGGSNFVPNPESEVLLPPGTKLKIVDLLRRDSKELEGFGKIAPSKEDGESSEDHNKRIWHSERKKPISPDDLELLFSSGLSGFTEVIVAQEV